MIQKIPKAVSSSSRQNSFLLVKLISSYPTTQLQRRMFTTLVVSISLDTGNDCHVCSLTFSSRKKTNSFRPFLYNPKFLQFLLLFSGGLLCILIALYRLVPVLQLRSHQQCRETYINFHVLYTLHFC